MKCLARSERQVAVGDGWRAHAARRRPACNRSQYRVEAAVGPGMHAGNPDDDDDFRRTAICACAAEHQEADDTPVGLADPWHAAGGSHRGVWTLREARHPRWRGGAVSGDRTFVVIGPIVAIVGLISIAFGARRRRVRSA